MTQEDPIVPLAEDQTEQLLDVLNGLGAVKSVNALGTVASGAVTLPAATVAAATTVTISASTLFTLPPPVPGGKLALLITQDGTGSRLGTFTSPSGSVLWAGGHAANALSTAAGAIDVVVFECRDTVNWYGGLSKAFAT